MKQELLEYIIRACAKEVLTQINEGESNKSICPQCNGKGHHPAKLKNLGTLDMVHHAAVPCDFPGCNKGTVDHQDNVRITRGLKEEEDTKGAPAPPSSGQGTADQPSIPKDKPPIEDDPEEPETPKTPELKGIVFVNPKDKSRLQKIDLKGKDDSTLERLLYRLASGVTNSQAKIAISTVRAVKDAIKNPESPVYLYVGKYDPNSDEIFLMADKSLQVAKDNTLDASTDSSHTSNIPSDTFSPSTATDTEFAQHMASGGKKDSGELPEDPDFSDNEIDENLKKTIKKMVNELLDTK